MAKGNSNGLFLVQYVFPNRNSAAVTTIEASSAEEAMSLLATKPWMSGCRMVRAIPTTEAESFVDAYVRLAA